MLIKSTDVIGLKVLTLSGGEKIEDVKDIIFSSQDNRVVALLVDSKGWFRDAKVILWEDITSIGKNDLMVESADALKNASEVEDSIAKIARDNTYLTHSRVVTENGNDLGEITDLYFDDKTGVVEEFEVTQGALNDIRSGRKIVKYTDILTVGKDATIVKGYTEYDFEDQAQENGLQGTVNKTGEAVKKGLTDAKDKVTETVNNAKEKIQQFPQDQRVQDTAELIKGKASDLKSNISQTLDNGRNRVNEIKNDPNNQQKVNDAANQASTLGSNLKNNATNTAQNIATSLTNAKNDLSSRMEEGKNNLQSKVEETQASMQEKKDNEAVGQYLTKDILSAHDEYIGRKGDMVTHKLLAKAKQNNVAEQVYANLTKESAEKTTNPQPSLKVEGNVKIQ